MIGQVAGKSCFHHQQECSSMSTYKIDNWVMVQPQQQALDLRPPEVKDSYRMIIGSAAGKPCIRLLDH